MVIDGLSNIFVTGSHLSNSLKHFQCNTIFFMRERTQNFEFFKSNLFIKIVIVIFYQILLKIYNS